MDKITSKIVDEILSLDSEEYSNMIEFPILRNRLVRKYFYFKKEQIIIKNQFQVRLKGLQH